MRLQIKNLTKVYKRKKTTNGIFDINLDIKKNTVFGLIGPNGAGKTTTFGIIATLIRPNSGDASIDGVSVVKQPNKVKDLIGYLSHESVFYSDMTVMDNLLLYARLSGISRKDAKTTAEKLIKEVGLEKDSDKEVSKISNGGKKKLGIAQAVVNNPKLLLLDEPFSGLDVNTKVEIRNIIKKIKKNAMIIISSHNLGEIEKLCEKVAIINNGKIIIENNVKKLKLSKNQITIELEKTTKSIITKIKKLSGVKNVVEENNKIIISFSTKGDNLQKVSSLLSKNKINPISIKRGNSIEDVFMENS